MKAIRLPAQDFIDVAQVLTHLVAHPSNEDLEFHVEVRDGQLEIRDNKGGSFGTRTFNRSSAESDDDAILCW